MYDPEEIDDNFLPRQPVARPFIKWVGGKTQLLLPILCSFPATPIKTYYEPFIGGGSVFFAMASEGRFESAVINDWNAELVNVYSVVRYGPAVLMDYLREIEAEYVLAPAETFQKWRATPASDLDSFEQAARMIFLNKTGFNGLYRQNKKGQFNVPWGKKAKVNLFDEKNMSACSQALSKVESFHTGDFAPAVANAGPGDVVYMDPPYVPHSATSNFTGYTSDGFSMEDQRRVADTARQLRAQGAYVVLSNNDVPAVRDLYDGFDIQSVLARRNINSKGDKRGAVGEVIIIGRPQ